MVGDAYFSPNAFEAACRACPYHKLREWPDDGTLWWWCSLCECWSAENHIVCRRHIRNVQWEQMHGTARAVSAEPEEVQQMAIDDKKEPPLEPESTPLEDNPSRRNRWGKSSKPPTEQTDPDTPPLQQSDTPPSTAVGHSPPPAHDTHCLKDRTQELRTCEDGSGQWPWCKVCKCWGGTAHIAGQKHLRRLRYKQTYQPQEPPDTSSSSS